MTKHTIDGLVLMLLQLGLVLIAIGIILGGLNG
jgi:hypothetical protein